MDFLNRKLPRFCHFQRQLSTLAPLSVSSAIREEWHRLDLKNAVVGKKIALGLGSRGISGLVEAATTLVQCIKESGGTPWVIPAMGSHGGATPQGQLEMLAGLGLTPASLGCDFEASMEVVQLGATPEGLPCFFSAAAAKADGILLFNRIKAHTSFEGPVESGIHKMLAIGFGKEKAATLLHARGPAGLNEDMPKVAQALLSKLPFLAGFAVIEDATHRPVKIRGLTAKTLDSEEPELLLYAKSLAPKLPFEKLDLLIVDKMGKDISGTGLDTHVVGRMRIAGEPEPLSPSIGAVLVLDLTDNTHGNALGIGLADFTVKRLVDKIDFVAMARNVLATGNLERGRVPPCLPNDEEAIEAALLQVFRRKPERLKEARVMRITNTLELGQGWISENLQEEAKGLPGMLNVTEPSALPFRQGHLF